VVGELSDGYVGLRSRGYAFASRKSDESASGTHSPTVTKRDIARERHLEASAGAEGPVHEQLIGLRADIDTLLRNIGCITPPRGPRLMAAAHGSALSLVTFVSLAAHHRRRSWSKAL
jgi:hypothetical protein